MLPFFPSPYLDELLYSVIARYHERSGNLGYKNTAGDLFGNDTACAVYDLPNRLCELSKRLPEKTLNTPQSFIRNHTLYPLYRPFLPPERVALMNQAMMQSGRGEAIHSSIGVMASSISAPTHLRYCPECMEADKKDYGAAYWHRTHQVAGVYMCSNHMAWLREGEVLVSAPHNKHAYLALNEERKGRDIRPCDACKNFEHYLAIATGVNYILQNEIPVLGLEELRKRYLDYLKAEGLASYVSDRIRIDDLNKGFNEFYNQDFLSHMQSMVDHSHQDNWLFKMLRKPRVSAHPIRHLLLMRFLGLKPGHFFADSISSHPFGQQPWPCLNQTCQYYKKDVIADCVITRDYDSGQPVCTFSCSCGFTYSRRGPDQQESDRCRIGRIKSFGETWERALVDLHARGKGASEAAWLLGVDPGTVKKQLDRLNSGSVTGYSIGDLDADQYRTKWQGLIANNPGLPRKGLRALAPAVYTWLYRHDRVWLEASSPKPSPRQKYNDQRVDWIRRDEDISNKVISVANEMRNSTEKPQRITISYVGSKCGVASLLQKHLDKLPKTKAALDSVVENVEQFRQRRIKFVIQEMNAKGEPLVEWKINRRAGIKPVTSKTIL